MKLMRQFHLVPACLFATFLGAQQLDWLTGEPVGFALNPGMPRHAVASAPGHLVAMRTVSVSHIYGTAPFGTLSLDALDPATGSTWLTCQLSDSVAVGAAVVHPAGIAYFSGSFRGDALEFCDGSQLPGIGAGASVNHFIMAWNMNTGMPLWSRNLSATFDELIEPAPLALDPMGNLWFGAMTLMDAHLVQVDFFGNDVLSHVIGGIRRLGTISFDPWGGLYVSGSCENGTLICSGQQFPVSSTEGYNMFVMRIRSDGTVGFAQFGLDVTFTDPTVVATSDGHAYVAGALHLDGEVWPGLQFEGTNWGADVFVARLDSTGQFLWGREAHPADFGISGDAERAQGPCIALDDTDRVHFTGVVRGVVDWGNGVLSEGTMPDRSLTVVAFGTDGTPHWASTSDPSPWFASAQGVAATAAAGAVHFVAHAGSEFTFDGRTVGADGEQTAVVGRINAIATGMAEGNEADAWKAWPNPAADQLFVQLEGTTARAADLMDSAGQRVRSLTLLPGRNTVDVNDLASGLYLLRVADGDWVRLVKE